MQEMESSQSDVSTSSGSESPQTSESSAPSQASAPGEQGSSPAASPSTSDSVPFHQHPRFQELISQNREFKERTTQYERAIQDMQRRLEMQEKQFSQSSRQEDELLSRLKQIDPEFGSRFAEIDGLRGKIEQFGQWQQEMQLQANRQQAYSSLENLYKEHKVPENLKGFYEAQIKSMAYEAGDRASVKDLPTFFKMAHESISKFTDEFRRKERESYVAEKSKGQTPASTTGGTATSGPAADGPKTLDDVKAKIASAIRASRQKI